MPLSLNQIVSRLRSLALSHLQIKSCYFGDVPEFDANGDLDYAACFIEMLPGSIDRTVHQSRFNFRVYFLDRVGVSQDTEGNETEVLSDMAQVAGDFLAMIMSFNYQDDWVIVDQVQVTPMTESLNDMVAGVFIEIGVLVDYLADRCVIPATDVEFETDIDMPRTKIFTYDALGTEGNTWSVPTLSGKAVLASWRAGSYKRVIHTIPDDDEEIQVGSTDLGTGKGILGTGTVVLNTGDAPIVNEKFDFLYYS